MASKLHVVDSITNAGSTDRTNEDALGHNADCAFVIDGATGLGDRQVFVENGTDAAWLASKAVAHFEQKISRHSDIAPSVTTFIGQMREEFFTAADQHSLPRYAWPSASFAMLHLYQNHVRFTGLGDCTLFLQIDSGVKLVNPMKRFEGAESKSAAQHLQRVGGFGSQKNLLQDAATLQNLRSIRVLQNTVESGVWTLGLEPMAAENLSTEAFAFSDGCHALLCSDGFSALVTDYQQYSPETLLDAALSQGLDALMEELRFIERVTDSDGRKYPRFKQSDDATALLLKLST
ncbi:MAG: hypothetical protein GKR97_15525 [Rhizobiaceae bacterium]|nr:hypothetical protein [Rhizobiaceae bacterium]